MILSGCGAAEIPATENTAPVQTTAEEAVPAAVESVSTTSVTKVPELDLDALTPPTEPEEQLSPAELKLRDMTLEEKVGQLFVIRPEQLAGSISEEGIGNSGDEGLTSVSDDIGETGDAEKAREAGAAIGGYLAEYGFTGDLAPVADINSNPDNIVIGDRAFGDDPETVSAMVSAFIDGLPASLSKEIVTDRLRGELGYDGIVITDALAMSAVTDQYGSGQAAVLAFQAGNDILLMPESIKPAYGAVLEAVKNGEISVERLDESVLRILRYKLER